MCVFVTSRRIRNVFQTFPHTSHRTFSYLFKDFHETYASRCDVVDLPFSTVVIVFKMSGKLKRIFADISVLYVSCYIDMCRVVVFVLEEWEVLAETRVAEARIIQFNYTNVNAAGDKSINWNKHRALNKCFLITREIMKREFLCLYNFANM